jgi:hypothetical protein
MAYYSFNYVMGGITAEMNRLGWTTEQGRQYLLETYGKRSRSLLTDPELIEFWEHLMALPTPPCGKYQGKSPNGING